MEIQIVKQIAITLLIGFMLGLQREIYYQSANRNGFAGARTFALIALLGYLSAWVQESAPFFILVSIFIFGMLAVASYFYKTFKSNFHGSTTEVSSIITYILGVMVQRSLDEYAVFIAVVMLFLLGVKGSLAKFEKRITLIDIRSVTLFLAMTFVVLPLLPNRMIDPFGVFNPYKTWLMVVLIAGISFVGYVAIKILGDRRGIYLIGVFGGLASSTAASISLSKLYAIRKRLLKNFAGAIAMASTIMYLRVLFESAIFNPNLAKLLAAPYLAAAGCGSIFIFYLYRSKNNHETERILPSSNPLELSEALKLGLLFGIIFGSIGIFQSKFGNAGIYIISFLSGFTDVDAITLSLSQLAPQKISTQSAIYGIMIATFVNSLVKLGIVFVIGGKKIGFILALFFLLTIGAMGVGLAANSYH